MTTHDPVSVAAGAHAAAPRWPVAPATDSSPPLPEIRLLIAGRWVEGQDQRRVLDKYRLSPCGLLHVPSREQVAAAVAAANQAQKDSELGPHERGAILDRTAALLEQRSDQLVRTLQVEAGFTLADARGELKRCLQTFRRSPEELHRLAAQMVSL